MAHIASGWIACERSNRRYAWRTARSRSPYSVFAALRRSAGSPTAGQRASLQGLQYSRRLRRRPPNICKQHGRVGRIAARSFAGFEEGDQALLSPACHRRLPLSGRATLVPTFDRLDGLDVQHRPFNHFSLSNWPSGDFGVGFLAAGHLFNQYLPRAPYRRANRAVEQPTA